MTTANAAADERTRHLLEAARWLAKPRRHRGGLTVPGVVVCMSYATDALTKALEADERAQAAKPSRKGGHA